MVKWLLKLIVGSRNNRVIRKIAPLVVKINALEEELQNAPEEVLQEKTAAWKAHLERYTLNVETYSDRILRSRTPEENREVLQRWSEKFDSLASEFRKAGGFLDRSEIDGLAPMAAGRTPEMRTHEVAESRSETLCKMVCVRRNEVPVVLPALQTGCQCARISRRRHTSPRSTVKLDVRAEIFGRQRHRSSPGIQWRA